MKKLNTDLFGWMAAAILAGILASSGFQGQTVSFAVCDVQKVVKSSDSYKAADIEFQAKVKARSDLLEFIRDNRVISAEEWPRLRDLSLKDKPTDIDKSELVKVKDSISQHSKKLADLQLKPTKTADDVNIMEAFQKEVQQAGSSAQSLQDQFSRELPVLQDQAAKVVEDQARAAIQAVGKEQGYTIVFDMLVAPYGEHDITDTCLQRMNKK